ncbi:Putative P-loop containing nucleoside triphosphate hydrolase, DNA2/NAM7 helicase, helicase [Septoria linicola]|uniref:P-loop containing nucleoside triphosphate hydrolase, DNA2/NAM7 helicase, helicase n=1 Tax=Septoria linicola TaxID=215465 RepID=A0A9Q9EKK9_9PEZI|nr:Putative P-loop containing nucleoside triphosphate hydrolase, DNA2/NAM7 helicase, helicase [Septoria linicola]
MADRLPGILAHHHSLVDAVTGGAVTESTKLVALHQPPVGSLLAKLTGTAAPTKPCFLIIDDELFPPQDPITGMALGQFYGHTTFCDLLTLPRLRVEFVWPSLDLKVSIEARITENNTRLVTGVQRGEFIADELVITAESFAVSKPGASKLSRSGFTNAAHQSTVLNRPGQSLMVKLQSLFESDGPKTVRVRFFDTLANDRSSCFPELMPFVVGPNKLRSLSATDHSQLVPLSVDRTPQQLMASPAPFPMTPLESRSTYANIIDAQAQLFESSRVMHVEDELSLQQWSGVQHETTPYKLGGILILGVMFKPFTPLMGSNGATVQFRLPERMNTRIYSEKAGFEFTCSGFLAPPMAMLEQYDALFFIPGGIPHTLRGVCHDVQDLNVHTSFMASFEPRVSMFPIMSRMATASALQSPDVARWVSAILNQSPKMSYVDLATRRAPDMGGNINRGHVDRVYEMMLNWRRWNVEQLQALRSIRHAVGGIVLITGPAGCGKTLIQQIICAFFYLIGLHVLVLAPANSNVADFVFKLHKNFPSGDVEALRIFPRSAELKLKDVVSDNDAGVQPEAQQPERPLNDIHLFEFEMVRAEVKAAGEKYSKGRESGLQYQVLRTARDGSLDGTLKGHVYDKDGKVISKDKIDFWHELRKSIEQCEQHTFDWGDIRAVAMYEQSYKACKGHLVARNRLLVTTTGNVYSSDIQDFWAQDLHGVKCHGVVVIIDEACKDNEIDTLGPLMCAGFRSKITGMVMVGDDRQLEPTDTSAKGRVQFNPFPGRITMPFASRLKSQGHPCVELLEQHRMSSCIAAWPFNAFYPPGMRSSASTRRTLAEKYPGLRRCLAKTLGRDEGHLSRLYSDQDQDALLRTHYIQVAGKRVKRNLSTVVREHIVAFFNQIFWYLHAYYGTDLYDNVTIIVAYKEARSCWQQALKQMMRKNQMSPRELPNVITIDSSQGTEAPITIIDCSVQQFLKSSDLGFVDDNRRINVAMTRAQEVRWVLGGDCSANQRYNRRTDLPAYVRYRDHAAIKDNLTVFGGELLPIDGVGWLEKLETNKVELEITFADDRRRLTGN